MGWRNGVKFRVCMHGLVWQYPRGATGSLRNIERQAANRNARVIVNMRRISVWVRRVKGTVAERIIKIMKTYNINKGINRSIVFKGLVAQYIWYMGAVAFAVLMLYAAMYVAGVGTFISLAITLCLGAGLVVWIYHLSSTYGEHGLTKALARRSIPKVVKSSSRRLFKARRAK